MIDSILNITGNIFFPIGLGTIAIGTLFAHKPTKEATGTHDAEGWSTTNPEALKQLLRQRDHGFRPTETPDWDWPQRAMGFFDWAKDLPKADLRSTDG